MLKSMFEFLGSPDPDDTSFVTDPVALKYLAKFKKKSFVDLTIRFPHISPQGHALLRAMLTFNPFLRPKVSQLLESPYFVGFATE